MRFLFLVANLVGLAASVAVPQVSSVLSSKTTSFAHSVTYATSLRISTSSIRASSKTQVSSSTVKFSTLSSQKSISVAATSIKSTTSSLTTSSHSTTKSSSSTTKITLVTSSSTTKIVPLTLSSTTKIVLPTLSSNAKTTLAVSSSTTKITIATSSSTAKITLAVSSSTTKTLLPTSKSSSSSSVVITPKFSNSFVINQSTPSPTQISSLSVASKSTPIPASSTARSSILESAAVTSSASLGGNSSDSLPSRSSVSGLATSPTSQPSNAPYSSSSIQASSPALPSSNAPTTSNATFRVFLTLQISSSLATQASTTQPSSLPRTQPSTLSTTSPSNSLTIQLLSSITQVSSSNTFQSSSLSAAQSSALSAINGSTTPSARTLTFEQSQVSSFSTTRISTYSVPASSSLPVPAPSAGAYWLEQIKHQGLSAFNPTPGSYQVFRNVKDFGAKGDGVTDDTAAIQTAVSSGGRCAPGVCYSTTTPAIVYFPAGTYMISQSIIDYYGTQIIGNPNNMPVLRATSAFSGFGIIDGDPYGANGLEFGATAVFYRQIRNIIFDLTGTPSSSSLTALHWPTSQATSLQNCVFRLSDAADTQHTGLFIESGSGGFMADLVFNGGVDGAILGNQQFTVRNLTFNNAITAIYQIWDWGWTYQGITINNCTTGFYMAGGGTTAQSVGSITVLDSSIINTQVGIVTAHSSTSQPPTGGSIILENVSIKNVGVTIQGPSGTVLQGGSTTITAWGEGHQYTPSGPVNFEGGIHAFSRPPSLTIDGNYYTRSKPQYQALPVSSFISVRTAGAAGDGVTDDTVTINRVLTSAAALNLVVFFDAGTYKVTGTINVPPGSRIVGESYSVIMGTGSFFSNINAPQPVVAIGSAGLTGEVEWSDMIVSTQGATAGAILIQWNLASPASSPSGMWDVHTRIGGFAGSNLQIANCPTTPSATGVVNQNCIAAFMSMYIAPSATGLYVENTWLWTADHDIDDPNESQITVYTGRGLYCASTLGNIWLIGTAVEHHAFYQYQFASTTNIYAGQIQTETAYWQPNPNAGAVFPIVAGFNDPNFSVSCQGISGNCADGWGLRIVSSSNIFIYGAGLYSFFDNYSTACSNPVTTPGGNGATCQTRIFSIEKGLSGSSGINVYNLNVLGAAQLITRDGVEVAHYSDNINAYQDTVALFASG